MKRKTIATVIGTAVGGTVLAFAAPAEAANPHVVTGFADPGCVVIGNLQVDCVNTELAGVGNVDAVATLSLTFDGTVDCNNPSENNKNNPIESHETTFDVVVSSGILEPKNGRLVIPALSGTSRDLTDAERATLCPNPQWVAVLRDVSLVSFTYTITFDDEVFFTVTGP